MKFQVKFDPLVSNDSENRAIYVGGRTKNGQTCFEDLSGHTAQVCVDQATLFKVKHIRSD